MDHDALAQQIANLWDRQDDASSFSPGEHALITAAVELLDSGDARVAEIINDDIVVHDWLKQAILLYFSVNSNAQQEIGPFEIYDKVPLKSGFDAAGVRVVPGAIARWG